MKSPIIAGVAYKTRVIDNKEELEIRIEMTRDSELERKWREQEREEDEGWRDDHKINIEIIGGAGLSLY